MPVHVVSVSGSKEQIMLMGLPSIRSGPLVVCCMGYNGVFDLWRSTHLACHIVCPALAILLIGVVVFLEQT